MTFTYPPETYMELLRAYNELEAMAFSPEDSRETVISKLEERSAKKRQIADAANTMVREYVEAFEKEPDKLTPEDAETLQAFAELLMPTGSSTITTVTDYGMKLRLGKILMGYYRGEGDWDRFALALQQFAIGYVMIVSQHSYEYPEPPFAGEVLALARRLAAGAEQASRPNPLFGLYHTVCF